MQLIQEVKRWTDQERQIIIDNFATKNDTEIGEMLNRSTSSIKAERLKLDLRRSNKGNPGGKQHNKKHRSLSFDEVKNLFLQRGYILLSNESEYKTCTSKLRYICEKHKDKGEQTIDLTHLKRGQGCYYCGRERTNEAHRSTIDKESDRTLCELKGFEYVTTKYEDGLYMIYFICPKHRVLGVQKMRRGNMNRECVHGCQYCFGKNLPDWYVRMTIEEKYPNLIVESEYKGMNKMLCCYCKEHDEHFSALAKDVFYHGRGCEGCEYERRSSNWRLSEDEIKEHAYIYNPNVVIENIGHYENVFSKMDVRCLKCGHTWKASLSDLRNQAGHCPNCDHQSKSIGELQLANILDKIGVFHTAQYRIDDCRDKRTLPFDECILNDDMTIHFLIEYQGEQHYHPVDYFGGEPRYKEYIRRDKIKKDYCADNGIPLLIIPYWDCDKMEQIVIDFMKGI